MNPLEELDEKIKAVQFATGRRPRWVRVNESLYEKLLHIFAVWRQQGSVSVYDGPVVKLLRPSWSGVTIVCDRKPRKRVG